MARGTPAAGSARDNAGSARRPTPAQTRTAFRYSTDSKPFQCQTAPKESQPQNPPPMSPPPASGTSDAHARRLPAAADPATSKTTPSPGRAETPESPRSSPAP